RHELAVLVDRARVRRWRDLRPHRPARRYGRPQGLMEGAQMADIVNLRQARKSRAKAKARAEGDASAAKFGRTQAQKKAEDDSAARARRHLDGHKREPDAQ